MPFQKQVWFLFTGCFFVPRTEKLLSSPFIRIPLFSPVAKLQKAAPPTPAFADAENKLTAAQSHQVHAVTQYGPSGGSFAYEGTSFRAAAASGTAAVT